MYHTSGNIYGGSVPLKPADKKDNAEARVTDAAQTDAVDTAQSVDAMIAEAVRAIVPAGKGTGDWQKLSQIVRRLGRQTGVEVAVVMAEGSAYAALPVAEKVIMRDHIFGVNADNLDFMGLKAREALFLKHLLDNVVIQHVRDGIALVIREEYKGYHKISVIDNGRGFMDEKDRHVPIAQAVSFDQSFGRNGIHGIGLTQVLRHGADFTLVDAVGEWAAIEKDKNDTGFSIISSGPRVKSYGIAIEGYFLTGPKLLKPFMRGKVRRAIKAAKGFPVHGVQKIMAAALGNKDQAQQQFTDAEKEKILYTHAFLKNLAIAMKKEIGKSHLYDDARAVDAWLAENEGKTNEELRQDPVRLEKIRRIMDSMEAQLLHLTNVVYSFDKEDAQFVLFSRSGKVLPFAFEETAYDFYDKLIKPRLLIINMSQVLSRYEKNPHISGKEVLAIVKELKDQVDICFIQGYVEMLEDVLHPENFSIQKLGMDKDIDREGNHLPIFCVCRR